MATIKDIAKYTGLALSTISKYLNGGNVRDKNKVKIEEALKVLNYRRNEAARSLKTNKSMTIGILIPNLKSSFDTTIISMVEERLTEAGYSVIICGYHKDPQIEAEKLKFLLNKRVDGLVTVPSGVVHDAFHDFIREGRPVVLIDRPLDGVKLDTILIDNVEASKKAVKQLFSLGHSKIGLLLGAEDVYTTRTRMRGYLEAFGEEGKAVNYNYIKFGDWSRQSGIDMTEELLAQDNRITSMLICGDDMGYGVLKALQNLQVNVPEELSLICFDLHDMADILRPRITTVEQPIREIGDLAATLLLRQLSGDEEWEAGDYILKAGCVIRDSTKEISRQ